MQLSVVVCYLVGIWCGELCAFCNCTVYWLRCPSMYIATVSEHNGEVLSLSSDEETSSGEDQSGLEFLSLIKWEIENLDASSDISWFACVIDCVINCPLKQPGVPSRKKVHASAFGTG